MTSILTAVGAAMREVRQDETRAKLAEQADRLGQAAGRTRRRHHQWRHRSRHRRIMAASSRAAAYLRRHGRACPAIPPIPPKVRAWMPGSGRA